MQHLAFWMQHPLPLHLPATKDQQLPNVWLQMWPPNSWRQPTHTLEHAKMDGIYGCQDHGAEVNTDHRPPMPGTSSLRSSPLVLLSPRKTEVPDPNECRMQNAEYATWIRRKQKETEQSEKIEHALDIFSRKKTPLCLVVVRGNIALLFFMFMFNVYVYTPWYSKTLSECTIVTLHRKCAGVILWTSLHY